MGDEADAMIDGFYADPERGVFGPGGRSNTAGIVFDPEPQPAHDRDTPGGPALVESERGPVPGGVFDALAARHQVERTARLAAERDLERARRILGQGPYLVVKLDSLNALTDAGNVEVRLAFGGGITTDMVRAVLDLGEQAARQLGMQGPARAEQQATVRIPDQLLGDDHNLFRCRHPDCVRDAAAAAQPAEKPQEQRAPWVPGFSRGKRS